MSGHLMIEATLSDGRKLFIMCANIVAITAMPQSEENPDYSAIETVSGSTYHVTERPAILLRQIPQPADELRVRVVNS